MVCKFADGWKNKEGWLVSNGKLICLDWDAYCTECRLDNSNDYIFVLEKLGKQKNDSIIESMVKAFHSGYREKNE